MISEVTLVLVLAAFVLVLLVHRLGLWKALGHRGSGAAPRRKNDRAPIPWPMRIVIALACVAGLVGGVLLADAADRSP